MPIINTGGVLVETPVESKSQFERTGVIEASQFAICDSVDRIKQIKFDPSAQTTNTSVTFKSGSNASSIVLTLPTTSGTLSTAAGGASFTTMQTPAGTSPVATTNADTLTFTSSNGSVTITGNSATDTIDFTAASGSGTVSSVSVVSANGFAGTVATATTTPAITLTTSVTGVLKGNGTAISAATSGTDYSAGTSGLGTGILKSTTGTGALTIAVAGDFPTLNQNTNGTAAGNTTYTANNHGVVVSGTGNAMTVVAPNASTAYPLVSGGASADPSWALLTGAGGGTGVANSATLTYGSNNITLATGGVTSVTLPTSGTLATLAGAETLTNKSLSDTTSKWVNAADATKIVKWDVSTNTTAKTLTLSAGQTNNHTITFPDATDTLVAKATYAQVGNKDFADNSVNFYNPSSGALMDFDASGATAAAYLTQKSNHTTNRTWTYPDRSDTYLGQVDWNGTTSSTLFDDFLAVNISGDSLAGDTVWTTSVTGTGAAVGQTAASITNPGILLMTSGTVSTNTVFVKKSFNAFLLGGGALSFDCLARVAALSTSTDEFSFICGLCQQNTTTPSNSVRWEYNRAKTFTFTGTVTNGANTITSITGVTGMLDINSIQVGMAITGTNIPANTTIATINYAGNSATMNNNATPGSGAVTITATVGNFWMMVTSKASTATYVTTSQAVVANTWTHLKAAVNAAATSVTFTLNSTAQTAITTNIPTTVAVGPHFTLTKSAGTTSVTSEVDYWWSQLNLTTVR